MNKSVIAALSILGLAIAGPVAAQGNASAGQAKSMVCAGCHGADGNSFNPEWPSLAGQHAVYIAKQLSDFKAGDRSNPLMSGQAMGLSDEDMQDLAAYFASLKAKPTGKASAEKVELGEALYRGGNTASGVTACAACHGPAGSGNAPAKFPALAGQHAAYTTAQIKAFRSGERANDLNGMMGDIAKKMTDAEIEAVSQYIQGLRGN